MKSWKIRAPALRGRSAEITRIVEMYSNCADVTQRLVSVEGGGIRILNGGKYGINQCHPLGILILGAWLASFDSGETGRRIDGRIIGGPVNVSPSGIREGVGAPNRHLWGLMIGRFGVLFILPIACLSRNERGRIWAAPNEVRPTPNCSAPPGNDIPHLRKIGSRLGLYNDFPPGWHLGSA